jgi:hypothetical protein
MRGAMKNSLNFLCKFMVNGIILGGMLGLVSCAGSGESSVTTLTLLKDGSVRSEIRENFGESYYDSAELQNTILSQTADYNREAGSSKITVEKVEAKDDIAVVKMIYEKPEDYASFNRSILFVGTAKEAKEAGYQLDLVLSGTKDANETIGMSDMLAMDGEKILITDVKDRIVLNGKALYTSDNVTVSDNGKEIQISLSGEEAKEAGDKKALAYVVFE